MAITTIAYCRCCRWLSKHPGGNGYSRRWSMVAKRSGETIVPEGVGMDARGPAMRLSMSHNLAKARKYLRTLEIKS